ncbi:hypothetical protein MRX96_002802 [Rhipicephalus microplus]
MNVGETKNDAIIRVVALGRKAEAAPTATAAARNGPLLHRRRWLSFRWLRRRSLVTCARGNAATARRAALRPNNPRRRRGSSFFSCFPLGVKAVLSFFPTLRRAHISHLTRWPGWLNKSRVASTTLEAIGAWDTLLLLSPFPSIFFSGGAKRRSGLARAGGLSCDSPRCGALRDEPARVRPLEESDAVKLIWFFFLRDYHAESQGQGEIRKVRESRALHPRPH